MNGHPGSREIDELVLMPVSVEPRWEQVVIIPVVQAGGEFTSVHEGRSCSGRRRVERACVLKDSGVTETTSLTTSSLWHLCRARSACAPATLNGHGAHITTSPISIRLGLSSLSSMSPPRIPDDWTTPGEEWVAPTLPLNIEDLGIQGCSTAILMNPSTNGLTGRTCRGLPSNLNLAGVLDGENPGGKQ